MMLERTMTSNLRTHTIDVVSEIGSARGDRGKLGYPCLLPRSVTAHLRSSSACYPRSGVPRWKRNCQAEIPNDGKEGASCMT